MWPDWEGSTHAKSRNLKSILENLNSHEDLGLGREWDHELFPCLFVFFKEKKSSDGRLKEQLESYCNSSGGRCRTLV